MTGTCTRLAFQAGEQRLLGDPGVLDGNLERECDGFIQADGALRAEYDVADLKFHVLVIDAAVDDSEIHLLIADREQRHLPVRGRRCVAALGEGFDLLSKADPLGGHGAWDDADRVDG